ncbi:MAG: hypothetical protein JXX29_03890 [Deltaproteobacteria bacterium]|nr:hypothetical protein [Deltaproteobacteria bacterium]MBN2670785.1 hypothetical protein [Deltaproteobacteria bacterium]
MCNYQAEVAQRKPDSDNRVVIPPNHPDINYFGRVDCTTPAAPTFSYPGVTIRTGFSGSSIHMDFLDSGNHTNTNYYDVSIDDAPSTRLAMIPGTHTYALAENLRAGAHTIEIFKRVESNYGTGQGTFLGFRIDAGETILPVPPKPYRIEFIGDSITCGYGNTVAVDTPGEYHYTTETANAHKSWAAITAEQIHAELSIVAYSGRGVFRNVNGMKGNTIPKMYFKTLPDHPQGMTWEPNRFIPDIVVINLGTNDFSPSLSESKLNEVRFHYHETTAIFVATLRKTYPQAAIILAVGPMLSDDYPEGYNALSSVTAALRHIVNARSAEGDTNMYFIQLPREASLWGADWHPTETTHRKMADALVTFLRQRRIVL